MHSYINNTYNHSLTLNFTAKFQDYSLTHSLSQLISSTLNKVYLLCIIRLSSVSKIDKVIVQERNENTNHKNKLVIQTLTTILKES